MSKICSQEHYVQQRYLKHFSSDEQNKHIHVFDKLKNEVRYNQPIDRIACEGGFYDLEIDKIVNGNDEISKELEGAIEKLGKNFIDKYLTNYIEPLFDFVDDIIVHFANGNIRPGSQVRKLLDYRIRNNISNYITYQYLRTLSFRNLFTNLLMQENKMQDLSLINSEQIKLLHSKILVELEPSYSIQKSIEEGIWILCQVEQKYILYTSDNPIYVLSDNHKKPGIFTDVLLVSYPLSPKLLLLIMSPSTAKRKNFLKYSNKLMSLHKGGIDYFNNMVVSGAYRSVYFSRKEFKDAKRFYNYEAKLSKDEVISRFYNNK